jgi:hypothetical protein
VIARYNSVSWQRYFTHLAHEAAYKTMYQAAQDLHSWMEAEWLPERVL